MRIINSNLIYWKKNLAESESKTWKMRRGLREENKKGNLGRW